MNYRTSTPRGQGFLFNNIEDWISEDNPVRLLDLLIDKLYESAPSKFESPESIRNAHGGRPAYHPTLFCKLYLYGYLNRINSSRRLEAECGRNMELMWLLSLEKPDFKTISNFRRDRGELIRYCTTSFRGFLKAEGYIKGDTVAIDGCKIKANATKEGYTMAGVIKRLLSLETQLEVYLSKMDKTDIEESPESSQVPLEPTDLDSLKKEISRLQRIKTEMEQASTGIYFPNDPDSRMMKGRYGSYPAYNVQGGMDAENHMVVMAEVTNQANDWNQLESDVQAITEELSDAPGRILADKGYANKELIKAVESASDKTKCVIPLQESDRIEKDRKYKLVFTYNAVKDVIQCPCGKELPLRNACYTNRHGTTSRLYRANKSWCEKCPKKDICSNTQNGRTYYISTDEFIRDYTQRTHTDEFRKQSAKRKSLIEHLFGTFRIWMGKTPFLLSGLRKVQTEIDLYATAYNFKRLMAVTSVKDLMDKLRCKIPKERWNVYSNAFICLILRVGTKQITNKAG